MGQKFIVLGMTRTGSGYLYTMLDSHPDFVVHGEVFNPRGIGALSGKLKRERWLNKGWLNMEYREKKPIEFLEKVLAYDKKKSFSGVKLFFPQNAEVVEYVISSNEYKKIVLRRDNSLAAYSSARTAQSSGGKGKVRRGDINEKIKVTFRGDDFEKFVVRREKYYQWGVSLLKQAGDGFLEVEYNALHDKHTFNNILDYLGASKNVCLDTDLVKRNPADILERFSNPEEVLEYVKQNGKTQWLENAACVEKPFSHK